MMREEHELRDLLTEYVLGTLDPASADEVRDALTRSPHLASEMRAVVTALYALPEELDPEPAPAAVWERIRAGARALSLANDRTDPSRSALAAPGAPPAPDAPVAGGAPRTGADAAAVESRQSEQRACEPITPVPEPGRRRRPIRVRWMVGLGAALAAVLLAATSSWALHATRQSHRLAREEQIIAYWMRNPDLRILQLQPVAGGEIPNWTGTIEVSAGIVCVLPDGRAMMLQPSPPPAGTRYVLYGDTSRGRVELGETRQRFLLFDGHALSGVALTVEGRRNGTVAQVRF